MLIVSNGVWRSVYVTGNDKAGHEKRSNGVKYGVASSTHAAAAKTPAGDDSIVGVWRHVFVLSGIRVLSDWRQLCGGSGGVAVAYDLLAL